MGDENSKEAQPSGAPAGGDAAAGATGSQAAAAAGGSGGGNVKQIKLVLCGDTAVGKSCLITNYLHNSFSEDYEPTVLDVYKGVKNVNKQQLSIEIHDTSGDEHLGVNRKVQYQGADCFMICVACNQKSSFDNIDKWRNEISEVEPEKPVMLILTKSDMIDLIPEENAV